MRKLAMVAGGAALMALLATQPSAAKSPWWNPWSRAEPATSAAPAQNGFKVAQSGEVYSRLDRMEAQMRTLTGQIEQLSHQLRQLQDQLVRMQQDYEYRFGALENGNGGAPPRSTASAPPPANNPPPADTNGATMAGNPPPANPDGSGVRLGTPPRPLGTLTMTGPQNQNQGDQPLDLSSLARGGNAPAQNSGGGMMSAAPEAPSGDPRSDYERAYQHILTGDYAAAEAGFRQFLKAYPNDAAAPDAQYWLGESLFARGKYRESADAFLAGYKAYPKSSKGPDTLLKLGLSLAGLGERDAACSTYAEVLKRYPKASNALRQRVLTEQASANCRG